jgi:hypothetical protein
MSKALVEWRGIPLAVEFTYYRESCREDDSIDIDSIAVVNAGVEVDEIDEFINKRAEGEILDAVRGWIDLQNEGSKEPDAHTRGSPEYFFRGVHC